MSSYLSYARSNPSDTPKAEAGVAEWSRKIRELQKQVDLDEEQETKKLEAEIAASRLARASRRYTPSARTDSPVDSSLEYPSKDDSSESILGRSDALRKLVAQDSHDQETSRKMVYDYNAVKSHVPGSKRAPLKGENMSLAAFMGGTASGPRLNKVAPAPEYDPELYAPRPQVSGAHPIFGVTRDPYQQGITFNQEKRGIALPGMGTLRKTSPGLAEPSQSNSTSIPKWETEFPTSPVTTSRPRSRSDVNEASPAMDSNARPPLAPKPVRIPDAFQSSTQRSDNMLPRVTPSHTRNNFQPTSPLSPTTTTKQRPITPEPLKPIAPPWSSGLSPQKQSPVAISSSPERRQSTSYDEFGTPSPHRFRAKSIEKPVSPKPVVASPQLARPIQPDVKPIKPTSPSIPASAKPSPAFLKAPAQKELTPSLSRLQGRGFVEQRVKASAAIGSAKDAASSSPSPGKKANVLSRWPPASTSTPDLLESNQGEAFPESPTRPRRVSAIDRDQEAGIFPGRQSKTAEQPRRPPGAIALPSLAKKAPTAPPRMVKTPQEDAEIRAPPVALPGLGSSSTMISYVRAQRTGQSEPESAGGERGIVDKVAPVLTHPTKTRAKKPQGRNSKSKGSDRVDALPVQFLQESRHDHSPDPKPSVSNDITSEQVQSLESPRKVRQGRSGSYGSVQEIAKALMEDDDQPTTTLTPAVHHEPFEDPKPTALDRWPGVAGSLSHEDTVVEGLTPSRHAPTWEESEPLEVAKPLQNHLPRSQRNPENRRSSAERFSAIALPPLKEEATPTSSPASTLPRQQTQHAVIPSVFADFDNTPANKLEKVPDEESSDEEESGTKVVAPIDTTSPKDLLINFDHHDEPLPQINYHRLILSREKQFTPDSSLQPISTEVLLVEGTNLVTLTFNPLVVYDTECVAIVTRAKSRSTSLVSTKIFAWQGRSWNKSKEEEKKLNSLKTRYGCSINMCRQGNESAEFMHDIGNILVTRQGTRAHWTIENTTMHRVRNLSGAIMIDEVDFKIGNLCSAGSYILSVLGTLYVWHGRGSLESEQKAALQYAQTLLPDMLLQEFGEGNEDEMFWMMLGDDFASADYWKFRREATPCEPRVFEITHEQTSDPLQYRPRFTGLNLSTESIIVVDCYFELFVLVGPDAREKRKDIRIALNFADEIARQTASTRPFSSPVHVIILPSTLPVELRIALRFIDEDYLNKGSVPSHMNLLPLSDAQLHIRTPSWSPVELADETFLPLGLGPSML